MAVIASKVVPTEYDIEYAPSGRPILMDDRGRLFIGNSLDDALDKAEAAQDPADPIHHPPYPSPAEVPLP